MKNWLSKLMSGGVGDIVTSVSDVVDKFTVQPEEKVEMMVAVEKVVTDRMALTAQQLQSRFEMVHKVVTAEMASGDNYTKRARPTLVYFGMLMIFINYLVVPIAQTFVGSTVEPFPLPTEFWVAWGGTVAVWSVGRSAEKRGVSNAFTSKVTGNPNLKNVINMFDEAA